MFIPVNEKFDLLVNDFKNCTNNHIFNDPRYFELHSDSKDDVYIQLVRKNDSMVCATIAIYKQADGTFSSPNHATFGGVSINHKIELFALNEFVRTTMTILRSKKVKKVSVTLPPANHNLPEFSMLMNIFIRQGFTISSHELNYEMNIDSSKFESRISHGNRKRLKKCRREGFISEKLCPSYNKSAYATIQENRTRRGFPLSMSYEKMEEMDQRIPEKIIYFGVFTNSGRTQLAAASLCIAISSDVFYVFYWGDANNMEAYSPVVLLANEIYAYCQKNNFRILDVGTSSINGEPNYGLVRFKKNLGFSESLKLTLKCENV